MHVADGVDVDQEPDSRDDEQHDARERIDEIGEIDGEVAAEDPLIGDDFMGRAGPQDVGKHADRAEKRQIPPIPRQAGARYRGNTACRAAHSEITASKGNSGMSLMSRSVTLPL